MELKYGWMGKHVINLLLIIYSLHYNVVFAQESNPMFYKEIQLSEKSYSLESLTREIQQQTGITFSYNATKVNAQRRISVKKNRITLEQLLPLIKKHSGIGYKIINRNHIIYTISRPKTSQPKVLKKVVRKKKVHKDRPVQKDTVLPLQSETVAKRAVPDDKPVSTPIAVIGDSAVAAPYYSAGGGGNSSGGIMVITTGKQGKGKDWEDPFASLNFPVNGDRIRMGMSGDINLGNILKQTGLLEVGFSSDEIFYFNPTINLGFSFLYGTFAYNIGSYSHLRYGVGTGAKISEHYSLRLSYNTGGNFYNESNYSYFDTLIIPPPDSLSPPQVVLVNNNVPITIQSKLNRFNLTLVWSRNKNFSVSGGLTWNQLQTNYFSGNLPFSPSSLPTPITESDRRMRTVNPPYAFGTTFNAANTANEKFWIGLHVTLLYRIPVFK